ncbi:MAG TPA: hypothetical protein VG433_13550 [Pirellulales bacterium]|nr:hypothetical protein [Pirellulales bacterium]
MKLFSRHNSGYVESVEIDCKRRRRFAGEINMTASHWTEADTARAREIWSAYQHHHDLSGRAGQAAGIEPTGGRVWFGKSIQDVIAQRDADGSDAPLFFVRVSSDAYYRKGSHR